MDVVLTVLICMISDTVGSGLAAGTVHETMWCRKTGCWTTERDEVNYGRVLFIDVCNYERI